MFYGLIASRRIGFTFRMCDSNLDLCDLYFRNPIGSDAIQPLVHGRRSDLADAKPSGIYKSTHSEDSTVLGGDFAGASSDIAKKRGFCVTLAHRRDPKKAKAIGVSVSSKKKSLRVHSGMNSAPSKAPNQPNAVGPKWT